jgi:hypothetical protein
MQAEKKTLKEWAAIQKQQATAIAIGALVLLCISCAAGTAFGYFMSFRRISWLLGL